MNDHEEFLEAIAREFPNKGVWRWLEKDVPKTKGKLLVAIVKMRKAGMEDKDIGNILEDLFFAAYAERDLQVKEKIGMSAKEVVEFVEKHKQLEATAAVVQPEPQATCT